LCFSTGKRAMWARLRGKVEELAKISGRRDGAAPPVYRRNRLAGAVDHGGLAGRHWRCRFGGIVGHRCSDAQEQRGQQHDHTKHAHFSLP
jgi:hypothetical protein